MFNNQQNSGGWRFGDRPTSVEALYQQPSGISNDFLKQVAALAQNPATQGLLDQSVMATPLSSILDATGSDGWGGGSSQSRGGSQSGATGIGTGKMSDTIAAEAMQAAMSGAKTGSIGGLLGTALGAMNGYSSTKADMTSNALSQVNAHTDPIQALNAMQGWTGMGAYGSSMAANGAPTAEQAQAIADSFAASMAADGYGGFDSSSGVGGLDAGGSPDGYW